MSTDLYGELWLEKCNFKSVLEYRVKIRNPGVFVLILANLAFLITILRMHNYYIKTHSYDINKIEIILK